MAVESVRDFATPESTARDPAEIKRLWLVSCGATLARDRMNNDRRAGLGEAAAIALLVGLITVAGQALVVGADELLTPSPLSRAAGDQG